MKLAPASSLSTARCASERASAAFDSSDAFLGRRGFLAGAGGAAVALSAPALALADTGPRRFTLVRDGSNIGTHTLSAARNGDRVIMTIRIEIEVRVLGFRAYYYDHTNRELWVGGALETLESQTDDDGETFQVRVRREGDRLSRTLVRGGQTTTDSFEGDRAPTSYWNYAALSRRWFSSQSGRPLSLRIAQAGSANQLEQWNVTGDFQTTLFYDAAGEWRGCQFPARGELIRYQQRRAGLAFNTLFA